MPTFPNQGVQFASNAGTDPSVTPYTSATVSCTSTVGGTSITTVPADGAPVLITNAATATVYLGNQGVTTTTGYALAPSASVLVSYGFGSLVNVDRPGGQSCALYGIVASTASTVTYLTATAWPGNE
jgi:hypothetical protein